jgi:hypothetical protein
LSEEVKVEGEVSVGEQKAKFDKQTIRKRKLRSGE